MPTDIVTVIAQLQTTVSRGEANIARYRKAIDDENAKIADARTTLRTLQSMGVTASFDEPEAAPVSVPSNMTVPDMILWVMRRYPDRGFEPVQMIAEIKNTLGLDPDPNNVRPTIWRMKQDGRLRQDEHGRYWLPSIDAPTSESNEPVALVGSIVNPEHGR